MIVKWLLASTGCRLCWYSSRKISDSGDGDQEGGRSGVEGVLGGPGNVLTMGGGEGGDSIIGMKSANRFLARPKGKGRGRTNADFSEGMGGLAYGSLRSAPRPLGLGGGGALLLILAWSSGAGCRGGFATENGSGVLGGRSSGQSIGKAN